MSQGAGGRSVSPVLKYDMMVDRTCSPLFQIVFLMCSSITCLPQGRESSVKMIRDHGIRRLQQLISQGFSSPMEADKFGDTPLYLVPFILVRRIIKVTSAYQIL